LNEPHYAHSGLNELSVRTAKMSDQQSVDNDAFYGKFTEKTDAQKLLPNQPSVPMPTVSFFYSFRILK
jgi:hypothetical protein